MYQWTWEISLKEHKDKRMSKNQENSRDLLDSIKWRKRSLETLWSSSWKLDKKSPGGRGDKGEWWRRWVQLWCIVRIFVNVTCTTIIKRKEKQQTTANISELQQMNSWLLIVISGNKTTVTGHIQKSYC
jgi:beta-galactosidase/beta-glucuronidase